MTPLDPFSEVVRAVHWNNSCGCCKGEPHLKTEDRNVQESEKRCRLLPVYEGVTDGAPVHPPDLSTQGMFINTDDDLAVGATMHPNLRLALSDATVQLSAIVEDVGPGEGVRVQFLI